MAPTNDKVLGPKVWNPNPSPSPMNWALHPCRFWPKLCSKTPPSRTSTSVVGSKSLKPQSKSIPDELSITSLQVLAEALQQNTTLTDLNLSSNQIGDAGIQALVMFLKNIENLRIHILLPAGFGRCNTAQSEPYRDRPRWKSDWWQRGWGPEFCFLSMHFPNLLLDFTFCTSQALANAMKHNKTLTILELGHNKIGDKGVEARVLQFSISFRFHIYHVTGFSRCNEAQQQDPHLSRPLGKSDWWQWCWGPGLSISFRFTFCTSQALAKAVHHNQSLTFLDISCNDFGDAGRQARVSRPVRSESPSSRRRSVKGQEGNRGAAPGEQRSRCKGWMWTRGSWVVGILNSRSSYSILNILFDVLCCLAIWPVWP